MRLAIFSLICALGWMFPAWSQTKSGDEAKGASTVFGHVYCADTNAPARMALVVLQPAAALDHYEPGSTHHVTTHAEAVQTLVDGSYLIQHVAPGTYYVIATAPGYLSPTALFLADLDETSASKGVLKKRIADSLPRVTVRPNSTVSVNTTLERGAAVSGTITYDDGSPASGLFVQVLTRRKDQWVPLQFTPFDRTMTSVQTDDRGSYRISGLPAREYILEVQLNVSRLSYRSDGNSSGASSSQYASISTYSGGKTRSKTAVPFVLGSAEERRGEDIEIPASKFHTLRGSIVSARDGHVVNGGGLLLLYADDKTMAGSASLEAGDESFAFEMISEGDYVLVANGAADNEYEEIPNPPNTTPRTSIVAHPLHYYGTAEMPIHLTADLSGVMIFVPDAVTQPKPYGPKSAKIQSSSTKASDQ